MHTIVQTCAERNKHSHRNRPRPRCRQAQTHHSNLIVSVTLVGCLPCTRHCAGHHTHVTTLDPPKHLPTTSEASSTVIPILQIKKVREQEVRGHSARARAGNPDPILSDLGIHSEVHKATHTSRQTRTKTRNAQIHEHTHRQTHDEKYRILPLHKDTQTQQDIHASKTSDRNA